MPPEDNPMDDVQITKEEWQAGEIARLERELALATERAERGEKEAANQKRGFYEAMEKCNEQASRLAAADGLVVAVREERIAEKHDNLTEAGFARHSRARRAVDAAHAGNAIA